MASAFTNADGQEYRPPAFDLADYLVAGQPQSYVSDLNSTLTDRLYALYKAAPASVRDDLKILSGARSNERQQQLWDAALRKYGSPEAARKWVAPPGSSQHNKGNAVDFRYISPEAQKWVHEHAGEFGLHFRMGHEPWHVEPIKNWKGSVPPIPKVGIGEQPPIPVAASEFVASARKAFQASLDRTPLPRERPAAITRNGVTVPTGAPAPVTPSPTLAADRKAAPAVTDTASLLRALGALEGDVAASVTPRLPADLDIDNPKTYPQAPSRTNFGGTSVPMDQSTIQARATLLDEGIGSLLDPRSPNPAAANPQVSSANANNASLADDMAVLRRLVEKSPEAAPKGTMVAGRSDAPVGALPAARMTSTVASRPDAPLGSMPAAEKSIYKTTGGLAGTAALPAGYRPDVDMPTSEPPPLKGAGNTLRTTSSGLALPEPLSPPPAKLNTLRPTTSTVRNPEYDAWVKKYGDGSQVVTAPTGGMITAAQRAAISGSGAPVPVAKPANIPPAPPKTITVAKLGNTLTPPIPVPKPATFAGASSGKTYTVGNTYNLNGQTYVAQPNGTFKQASAGNTLPRLTSSSSSSTTSWGAPKTKSDGTSWAA